MRTKSSSLAIILVLISPFASAQWLQTNGLRDRLNIHNPLRCTNVFQETHPELVGVPARRRMQPDFKRWTDSLRASRMLSPLADEKFIRNGVQRGSPQVGRISFPQSQIYVIDTAVVLSTQDTTRHMYSFNAKSKRTSDLTQRLKGDLWVDTLRHTNTYDAGNNMISELTEQWSNGQLVKGFRETWTYDANGKTLSDLREEFSNAQWHITERYSYTYDANGNLTSRFIEQWQVGGGTYQERLTRTYDAFGRILSQLIEYVSNGQSLGQARDAYTYDTNGNLLIQLHLESWDWGNSWRVTNTYDTNGRRLSYMIEHLFNGQTWVYSSLGTYTYDISGKMLTEIGATWSAGQWINDVRNTHTYDPNGRELTHLRERWFNGQWTNDLRYGYAYDGDGRIINSLVEEWSSGQWAIVARSTFTYEASGKQTSFSDEYWSNGQWVNSRWTCTYDANGNKLAQVFEYWSGGQLTDAYRYSYTYDAMGNQTSYLSEQWSTGQWSNSERLTYTYDAQGNLASLWHHTWLNSTWSSTDYPWVCWVDGCGPGSWVVTDSAGNDYSLGFGYNFNLMRRLIVTRVATENGSVPASYSLSQNYPNPFNPTTNIQFSIVNRQLTTVKVYDMLGREVAVLVNGVKEPGTYTLHFDASNLSSGVYFCRLTAGEYVMTKRMLVLK